MTVFEGMCIRAYVIKHADVVSAPRFLYATAGKMQPPAESGKRLGESPWIGSFFPLSTPKGERTQAGQMATAEKQAECLAL